ncbi:RNA polymerase sigma factor SigB [Lysinibacillus piscis]|uniref:RNA polymerase sigma factor n=1 Tax=Lysinibacillus piscis TaxID=2518931 RepID=A0ABQ5NM47_9BACI|nr:RNA polymerase sigma factor SigB [Lysinibacillus sp. KH24]GLC89393.1 RNA polymerase sigma factor [Lysinibacillus sp. KH24]
MSKESQSKAHANADVLKWIELYQTKNDEEAQTNLVIHYRYLVESVAYKYKNHRIQEDDLIQVGMVGLLSAIRRFDPTIGRNFEAYAVPTIIGEIKRFLRDKTWDVYVPRRIKELGPRIKVTVEKLTNELQRSPTIEEIASRLQVSEEDVLETMEIGRSYQAVSMDRLVDADSESAVTLFDLVGKEDDGYEMTNRRMVVSEAMAVLDEREKRVIQLTYLEQLTQKEVGELLGISQMHVSRIQRIAIKKLQEAVLASDSVSL